MDSKVANRKIGIRADGNAKIGMGHLMRCLSVAEALRNEGVEVLFFTADEAGGVFVRERGFAGVVLGTDYNCMEAETALLRKKMTEEAVKLLLVDSYQATHTYLEGLRSVCPVFYMDDMGEETYPVDGVVNYNIYGADLPYGERYGEKVRLLLGSKYAPLRPEFRETPYAVREAVKTVLITMGGSDQYNISGALCRRLLATPELQKSDVKVQVICGRFNPHLNELREMAGKRDGQSGAEDAACASEAPRLEILSDVKDMWNCFADADIVIAAAGSTMYELATMGVPTVCCYYVENQRQLAQGFADRCEVINAGDYAAEKEKVMDTLVAEVLTLLGDAEKRKSLSESMKKVTDGAGARHLALELIRYLEEEHEKA